MYLDIVRAALDEGVIPRCHFEDITRADFYGFVVPFALELMRLSDRYEMPVKIRACDTMGYGVFYPGASLPRSVPGIMYGLTHLAGVPGEWLEWHGHNDFYMGVSNAATAWMYGCSAANCTLLGIGERTGNVPLEAMLIEYVALRGETNGVDTRVVTEIAEYYQKKIGYKIPPMQPLVGSDFNLTRAGIHADGLLKNEEIYNIFDTTRLLNRPPAVAVTDKSGLAGIAHWVNTYLRLPQERQIQKTHPGLVKMKDWVEEQYASDRVTSISEEELVDLARQHLPEYFPAEAVKVAE
jgi:isopropylmalate/homocitrate/citramalate synthase